jgi:histidine triad (HIT) family protein
MAVDESCVFDKIVRGEIPAHAVYEDDEVLAFLDIHPMRPGHTLVIPRRHVPNLFDLDEGLYSRLMLVVKQVAAAVQEVAQPKRVGLMVIGFEVPHAHVHVVPLEETRDIAMRGAIDGTLAMAPTEELREMATRLREAIEKGK